VITNFQKIWTQLRTGHDFGKLGNLEESTEKNLHGSGNLAQERTGINIPGQGITELRLLGEARGHLVRAGKG
jgi:hypothetical protein